jgi:hypothetical protein
VRAAASHWSPLDAQKLHSFWVERFWRPKVTHAGVASLHTPRECVAIGGNPVSLTVSGKTQLAGVRLSVSGGKTKAVARSPYRATLTLKPASKAVVVAQGRLSSKHGRTRLKSLRVTLTACP